MEVGNNSQKRNFKLQNMGICQDSKPYQALQSPIVLPTVPTGFLTYFSESIKISGNAEIQSLCPNFMLRYKFITSNLVNYTEKVRQMTPLNE